MVKKQTDTPPATTPATSATPEIPAKRQRNALSKEKELAIIVAGLVTILRTDAVVKVLNDAQKTQVDAADKVASDLNSKTIKPVQDRIAAIQGEFKVLQESMGKPDANMGALAQQAADLAAELKRKQKQLDALTKTTTAAAAA